ncbi:MAG: hypothetical protein AABZ46_04905 [Nitrospirota bacterium]
MRLVILSVFCALLVFVLPLTADSAEVSGRSSTQLLWYNDIVDASRQADVSEYLRFSVTGIDQGNNISLAGYGRLLWTSKATMPVITLRTGYTFYMPITEIFLMYQTFGLAASL